MGSERYDTGIVQRTFTATTAGTFQGPGWKLPVDILAAVRVVMSFSISDGTVTDWGVELSLDGTNYDDVITETKNISADATETLLLPHPAGTLRGYFICTGATVNITATMSFVGLA